MKFFRHLTIILVGIAIYSILFFVGCRQVHAQVIDSAFYDWTVYEYQEDELDEKKCYIVSHPISPTLIIALAFRHI
jgi:hypothetical protein